MENNIHVFEKMCHVILYFAVENHQQYYRLYKDSSHPLHPLD